MSYIEDLNNHLEQFGVSIENSIFVDNENKQLVSGIQLIVQDLDEPIFLSCGDLDSLSKESYEYAEAVMRER